MNEKEKQAALINFFRREIFAGVAMHALVTQGANKVGEDIVTERAYNLADAMIEHSPLPDDVAP